MALTTYSQLKTELEAWSSRDDITDRLDTFIDLTEAKLWQELRIRGMEAKDASLTSSSRLITVPTGYLEARRLRYVSGGVNYPSMTFVTPSNLKIDTTSGIPTSFTTYGSTIELNRNGSGTYELLYYGKVTALSPSNATNAIIDEHPGLYLMGGLAELFAYAQDSEEEVKWRAKFMAEIKDANARAKSGRYGPAPAASRQGSTP